MAVRDGTHGASDGMKCLCAELAQGCACVCAGAHVLPTCSRLCQLVLHLVGAPETLLHHQPAQHITSHHHQEELHVGNAHACRTTVHATTAVGQGWLVAHLCTSTCLLLLLWRQATLQKCHTKLTQ